MAATPPLGTYQSIDENNNVYNNLCAPRNAVATVEWVMAYASLAPGQLVGIDINQYATINQIKELQTQIDTMDSRVVDQAEKINKNTQNIAINTANIAELTKRMSTAELNITNNTKTINDMLDNPFPEGFWLICGEQLT
jgi:septal ring factor EnvC (AmiA/AmiB activator)